MTAVSWTEPTASDNSGVTPVVTQSHRPGQNFPIGTTQVSYSFNDLAGNPAVCSFTVTICKLDFLLKDHKSCKTVAYFTGKVMPPSCLKIMQISLKNDIDIIYSTSQIHHKA